MAVNAKISEHQAWGDSAQNLVARFALVGATLGLGTGLWEAGLLYFRPRLSTLALAEARWGIWFLAPLINSALFGLLGVLLGVAARWSQGRRRHMGVAALSILLGVVGAHVVWSHALLLEWAGNLSAVENIVRPLAGFAITLAASLLLARLLWPRPGRWICETSWSVRRWAHLLLGAAFILSGGTVAFMSQSLIAGAPSSPGSKRQNRSPNIILISLDAARADHFSSYGYSRPTTPNIDRLAGRGVLFENAISPASWTLPSLASVFTGLLPHQHGANEGMPPARDVWNLAEILRARGYETAGFSASPLYGQPPWGLAKGFETYGDTRQSWRYHLALTVAGRLLLQPTYEHLVRPVLFYRRNAADLNREVFRWHANRSGRPFFLFVHYLEPHDPYLPPPPFDHRFGRLDADLSRRVSFGQGLTLERPLSAAEREQVIAGYDNGLSYGDAAVGELLEALFAGMEAENTYVILTSDHGEAFGEHGVYEHSWTLHREVLHVPLIIAGPSVPAGLRIKSAVPIRQIFASVIDFASAGRIPLERVSLRRFWNPAVEQEFKVEVVISELSSGRVNLGRPPAASLTTSEWHYIHYATGRAELYHWPTDPHESEDLSERPEHQATVSELHAWLAAEISDSARPWRAPEYLFALDRPGYSFLRDWAFHSSPPSERPSANERIGMAQALFGPNTSAPAGRPLPSDEDLLRTLPYR